MGMTSVKMARQKHNAAFCANRENKIIPIFRGRTVQCASRRKSRPPADEKRAITKHAFLPAGNWGHNSARFILRMDRVFLTFVRLGGNVLAYSLEHPAGVDSRTTRAPDLPPWKAPPGRLFR